MGRSLPTEERTAPSPSLTTDIALRLQLLVAGWHGVERGKWLNVLHDECLNTVGPGGRHLLPAKLLLVKNLDETNLQAAIRGLNGRGRGAVARFDFKIGGRFDLALVPTGSAGEAPDSWLLVIEENLSLRDQVSLYGHAHQRVVMGHDRRGR